MSNSEEHDRLLEPCKQWLERNYNLVHCEMEPHKLGLGNNPLIPDVIGWDANGNVYVVDAKVTRADAVAQLDKVAEKGSLGRYCWIAEPVGASMTRPNGWGVLKVDSDDGVREMLAPRTQPQDSQLTQKILTQCLAKQKAREHRQRGPHGTRKAELHEILLTMGGKCEAGYVAKRMGITAMRLIKEVEHGKHPGVKSRMVRGKTELTLANTDTKETQ